ILFTIFVSLFSKENNMLLDGNGKFTFRKIINGLTDGARTALGVAAATACAGMIVGVVTKTGLGLKVGNGLVDLAGSMATSIEVQLLITLVFTMITAIVLGMGSPTTANYIITSTIALPAILALNDQLPAEMVIPVLAAHMFV